MTVSHPEQVKGKRVLVVGGWPDADARRDDLWRGPRRGAQLRRGRDHRSSPVRGRHDQGHLRKYTHVSEVLPAMGYGDKQMAELQETINAADCDLVLIGTPIDLTRM